MSEPRTAWIGASGTSAWGRGVVRAVNRRGLAMGCLFVAIVLMAGPTASGDRPDGCDVSHWQGDITPSEWTQAYNAGKVFCFTKATQGNYFTDGEFFENMNEGSAAGILMGCYHFADPEYITATAAANYFVSVAGAYLTDGYLRPVLDLEWGYGLGATTLSNWVNTWMDRVEQLTGVEPMIYCNTNYAMNYLNSTVANRTLWIAQWYPSNPETDEPNIGVFNDWAFWQWTDSCSIPGIGSSVDCDVFNGTLAQLQDYVIGGGTQPPTITQHPSDQAAVEGGTAQFTVQASGTSPLSYRWQKDSVNLNNGGHYSGVTTTTLTVSNVDGSDEASYRCRVTNAYGNATSNAATLTVVVPGDECVQNAGFEDGFTAGAGDDWSKYYHTGTVGFSSSTDSHSGIYSQEIDLGSGDSIEGGVYQQFSAVSGQQYTISAYIECDNMQVDGGVGADPTGGTDPAGGGISWDYTQSSTWNQQSVTVTASGNLITVFLNARGRNGTVRFDDVSPDCDAVREPPDFDDDGDVDQVDFGYFQACLTGPAGPQTDPDCQLAKLDSDTDVDQNDFGIFQGCISGPDYPLNPTCVE